MKSKQRWYQCWERINNPDKRPIQIYRQYHKMDAFPRNQVHSVPEAWIGYYAERGIDLRPQASAGPFWWDEDVVDWLLEFGTERFRRLDIWDVDWGALAAQRDVAAPAGELDDPRNVIDRSVIRFLRGSQRISRLWPVRVIQRLLSTIGW
jgi:hypothetical protein